jgi:hypothetical protein
MRGAIPPLPQYVFMAWCLVEHRDNFAFYMRKETALSYERSLFVPRGAEEKHSSGRINGLQTQIRALDLLNVKHYTSKFGTDILYAASF